MTNSKTEKNNVYTIDPTDPQEIANYTHIWTKLLENTEELTTDSTKLDLYIGLFYFCCNDMDQNLKPESIEKFVSEAIPYNTRTRTERDRFISSRVKNIIPFIEILRGRVENCRRCVMFGNKNFCPLDWRALMRITGLSEPSFVDFQKSEVPKFNDTDRRNNYYEQNKILADFQCNHVPGINVCDPCRQNIRIGCKAHVIEFEKSLQKINEKSGKIVPTSRFKPQSFNPCKNLVYSCNFGCRECPKTKEIAEHFVKNKSTEPKSLFCSECSISMIRRIQPPANYFITEINNLLKVIKADELKKVEAEKAKKKAIAEIEKQTKLQKKKAIDDIEKDILHANQISKPKTKNITLNPPKKRSASDSQVKIIKEEKEQNEKVDFALRLMSHFKDALQHKDKTIKDISLKIIQSGLDLGCFTKSEVRSNLGVGFERLKQKEKVMSDRDIRVARFVVEDCSNYDTKHKTLSTSDENQIFYATNAGYNLTDNRVKMDSDNNLQKKAWQKKYSHPRYVLKYTKEQIMKQWNDIADDQGRPSDRIGKHKFLQLVLFFCDIARDSDLNTCICSVCFNFECICKYFTEKLKIHCNKENPPHKFIQKLDKNAKHEIKQIKTQDTTIPVKDKDGQPKKDKHDKIIYEKAKFSSTISFSTKELIKEIESTKIQTQNHYKKLEFDFQGQKLAYTESYRRGYIHIHADWAMNIPLWAKDQTQQQFMAGHSYGLLCSVVKYKKQNSEGEAFKWYAGHISDCTTHDGMAVASALIDLYNLVSSETGENPKGIILRSDNASSQFKSRFTLAAFINVSLVLGIPIIQTWGIPQHGKDEVDHVGGLIKTSLKRVVRAQEFEYKTSTDIAKKITSLDFKVKLVLFVVPNDHYQSLLQQKIQPDNSSYKIKGLGDLQIIQFDTSDLTLKSQTIKQNKIKYFQCRFRSNSVLRWDNLDAWGENLDDWDEDILRIEESYKATNKFEYKREIYKSYDDTNL